MKSRRHGTPSLRPWGRLSRAGRAACPRSRRAPRRWRRSRGAGRTSCFFVTVYLCSSRRRVAAACPVALLTLCLSGRETLRRGAVVRDADRCGPMRLCCPPLEGSYDRRAADSTCCSMSGCPFFSQTHESFDGSMRRFTTNLGRINRKHQKSNETKQVSPASRA